MGKFLMLACALAVASCGGAKPSGTVVNTGTDTGSGSTTGTGADSATGTGTDTGTGTGTATATGTGTDTGRGTGAGSKPPKDTSSGIRTAYAAHVAGQTVASLAMFRDLAAGLPPPDEAFDAADWAHASIDGKFALVETGRCVISWSGGSSSRHCGEVLVDVAAQKIVRYLPVEPAHAEHRNAFFVGNWLVTWNGDKRELVDLNNQLQVSMLPEEPLELLPDGKSYLSVPPSKPAIFEVHDLQSHKLLAKLVPNGAGPQFAKSIMSGPLHHYVAGGTVMVVLEAGELQGYVLATGKRLFSFATDLGHLWVAEANQGKTLTLRQACDWNVRQPPRPVAGCTPKAACLQTPVCAAPMDADVDVATGKVKWRPVDPTANAAASVPPPAEPPVPVAVLNKMFCMAARELVVPAAACAK